RDIHICIVCYLLSRSVPLVARLSCLGLAFPMLLPWRRAREFIPAPRCALRRRLLFARRIYTYRALLSADPGLLQLLVSLIRHPGRQINGGVAVEDLDPADVHGVDRRLVRDCDNDAAGVHAALAGHGE